MNDLIQRARSFFSCLYDKRVEKDRNSTRVSGLEIEIYRHERWEDVSAFIVSGILLPRLPLELFVFCHIWHVCLGMEPTRYKRCSYSARVIMESGTHSETRPRSWRRGPASN